MSKCAVGGLTILAVVVASAGVAFAEPVTSGPQPGQKVPGPFHPLHVTGPDAGARVCLYCKYGASPVVMIFARDLSPALATLIQKVDAATAAHADCRMGSFATFLTDSPDLPGALKDLAARGRVEKTVLCTDAPAGPAAYKIAPDADVTVILYAHHTVKANHAFRKGELSPQAVDAIVGDVARILPTE
jgi:hypothetical protein